MVGSWKIIFFLLGPLAVTIFRGKFAVSFLGTVTDSWSNKNFGEIEWLSKTIPKMPSKKEITPPKTNMTMEKTTIFEDVKMYFLFKKCYFPACDVSFQGCMKELAFWIEFLYNWICCKPKTNSEFPPWK